jgi:hypothetical protein
MWWAPPIREIRRRSGSGLEMWARLPRVAMRHRRAIIGGRSRADGRRRRFGRQQEKYLQYSPQQMP